jgi:hypothetical protein
VKGFLSDKQLNQARKTTPNCVRCRADRKCSAPHITENDDANQYDVLFIQDNVTKEQDRKKFMHNPTLPDWPYAKLISAVDCRIEKITEHHINYCRPHVLNSIEKYRPKVVVPLGPLALKSLISLRLKKEFGKYSEWVGHSIPDQDLKVWIYPTYSTELIEEENSNQAYATLFDIHLNEVKELINKPFPNYGNEDSKIQIMTDPDEIIKYLKHVDETWDHFTFDYETTGLKPHRKGHEIICASISNQTDFAVSFPMYSEIVSEWVTLLNNSKIKKIAHNFKFEELWSYIIFMQPVKNWWWDSMVNAHLLDNRSGITSLKFQTYINFGTIDYDSEISDYLESVDGTSNGFNRVKDINIVQLLKYCGMDSMFGERLAMKQMEIML